MLCGHNAIESEETTLDFTTAGAGANQKEFAASKTDATIK